MIASSDGGASWADVGRDRRAGGDRARRWTRCAAGDAALFDRAASVEVELLNDAMWLEARDDDALVGGANLAMLGDELIQFGDGRAARRRGGGGCRGCCAGGAAPRRRWPGMPRASASCWSRRTALLPIDGAGGADRRRRCG